MGSITNTPLSTSIPNISTNLTSNDESNPSFSTYWVESQLDYNLQEEVGYDKVITMSLVKGFISLFIRLSNK
jgi:hypothetical protein